MNNTDLKPCPFCNSTDIRVETMSYFGKDVNKVMCWGCGIGTQYMPNNAAITRWNTRHE